MSFVNSYSDHFVLSTHDVTEKARQYTRGLMQAGARKTWTEWRKLFLMRNRETFNSF